jgi:hypothetical protein
LKFIAQIYGANLYEDDFHELMTLIIGYSLAAIISWEIPLLLASGGSLLKKMAAFGKENRRIVIRFT